MHFSLRDRQNPSFKEVVTMIIELAVTAPRAIKQNLIITKAPSIIKRTSNFTSQNKDAALSSLLRKNSKIMCTSGSTPREKHQLESLYDDLSRDWTMKFFSLTLELKKA